MNNLFFKSLFILILQIQLSQAQENYASSRELVAFDGYDLLTYFDNDPQLGHRTISYQYKNLSLRFVSEENKDKFIKNPEKYLPAYGGWCATALLHGSVVKPNFNQFKVQNERLMFFEVKAFFNGATQWNKDPEYNESMADIAYRKLTEDVKQASKKK